MALILADDPTGLPVTAIPGGAAAGTFTLENALPRVFVLDDLDYAGDWGWMSGSIRPTVTPNPPTISYDDTNGFIRVCFDDFPDYAQCAVIERSTDQAVWTPIRGGACAAIPVGGISLPGVGGSFASTPDDVSLDITGDIDIRADITPNNWLTPPFMPVVGKFTSAGDQRSYLLSIDTSGKLAFNWSTAGTFGSTSFVVSSVVPSPPASRRLAIRVTLAVATGTVTFYTAPTMAGPWTQLGSTTVAGATSIFSSTAILEVGSADGGTNAAFVGSIQSVQIRQGIDGAIVAEPVFWRDAPTGATTFTDDVGKIWTVNGSASIQHREVCLNDYEFTPCVTNYYRASTYPPGLYLEGATAIGMASTPDNAALDIVGDIDLRADVTLADWSSSPAQALISKWNAPANQRAYRFEVNVDGTLRLVWSSNGLPGTTVASTVAVPAADGARLAVRVTFDVDNGAGGNTATFYTAPTMAGPWTQLGAPVITAGVASIFNSNAALEVGSTDGGAALQLRGVIHAAVVLNGINGTAVANPTFETLPDGTTSFTDPAGRPWLITGQAEIFTTKAALASVNPQLTKIWLKSVTRPFLNIAFPIACADTEAQTDFELLSPQTKVTRPARAGVFPIVNRTYPVAVNDLRLGRRWDIAIRTFTKLALRSVDFLLASGDVILIQVPDGCVDCGDTMEAGYVTALDGAGYVRHFQFRNQAMWTIPLQEVAPPGPDIVYAEGTWATVIAQYGSWQAVLAAFSTWQALLAILPQPSEVIVP